MSESQTIKVVGKAKWPSVTVPNTKFEPVYSINLEVDDETRDLLVSLNLSSIKANPNEFKFKRPATFKDGSAAPAPNCVDAGNNDFTGMIGNGSEVVVDFTAKKWTYAGKSGTSAKLNGVMILDLVPYGTPANTFEAVEGFVAEPVAI